MFEKYSNIKFHENPSSVSPVVPYGRKERHEANNRFSKFWERPSKLSHYCSACCNYVYTECPGRNAPDFARMFLKLKYTDITQNTYIRSWTVTEIMAREKCGLLAVPPTLPGSRAVLPYTAHVRPSVYSRVKRTHTAPAHVKCLET